MSQYIRIGTVAGEQGFVLLSRVIGGLRGSDSWCVSVYRRDPTAIFGIREFASKDHLKGINDPTVNAYLEMVTEAEESDQGPWHRNYRCPAKIAQDLGWC